MCCVQVNLAEEMAARFEPKTASISFFGALYPVRCLTKRIQMLGSHGSADGKSPLSGIGNLFTQVTHLSNTHEMGGRALGAKEQRGQTVVHCLPLCAALLHKA